MLTFQGKSAFGGVAVGKIFVCHKEEQQIAIKKISDATMECERFFNAQEIALKQLHEIYENTTNRIGEKSAQIFEMHRLMLTDDEFVNTVTGRIKAESVNAEHAITETTNELIKMFSEMEDEYMKCRALDVKDISRRLLYILSENNEYINQIEEPSIIVADDLTPSETIRFNRDNILAFVTIQGSVNSHVAILAKAMQIPAMVCTAIPQIMDLHGKMAAFDGAKGVLYIEPEDDVLQYLEKQKILVMEQEKIMQSLIGKENVTKNGRKIKLYANIGSLEDLDSVFRYDAGGIGLFRSEFLYLSRSDYPTEEEQFEIYKKVAEAMAGKKVIFRTLDIGADKQVPYFHLDKEENPALGLRAIRLCLSRPDIFKTQLRALLRASVFGNVAIMYPMIISAKELQEVKGIVEDVREELSKEGIPFAEVEQGIMIETPAAAIMSDELAKEVDFFSIGTNDLTQYSLAIDRQNARLEQCYDVHHPAILRMIQTVIKNAHKEGIWVGICGELAADTSLTGEFLKMGIDELSVSPASILSVRKAILETDIPSLSNPL